MLTAQQQLDPSALVRQTWKVTAVVPKHLQIVSDAIRDVVRIGNNFASSDVMHDNLHLM
jgi:hypothetical protein